MYSDVLEKKENNIAEFKYLELPVLLLPSEQIFKVEELNPIPAITEKIVR
jgi:hypothetical protein